MLTAGFFTGKAIFPPSGPIVPASAQTNADTVKFPTISEMEMDSFRLLLKEFHAETVKAGLPYFLVSGSLIGAIRQRPAGPMQWDDDHDVGMFEEDYHKLIPHLQSSGKFNMSDAGFGQQLDLR
jgi:hypothetical protein